MSKVGMIAHIHTNKSSLAVHLLLAMAHKETKMRDIIVKEGLKHGITEAASDKVVDGLEAKGYTLTKKPPEAATKAADAIATKASTTPDTTAKTAPTELKVQPAKA